MWNGERGSNSGGRHGGSHHSSSSSSRGLSPRDSRDGGYYGQSSHGGGDYRRSMNSSNGQGSWRADDERSSRSSRGNGGGSGRGGYRNNGNGGRNNKNYQSSGPKNQVADITKSSELLPMPVTKEIIRNAPLGWLISNSSVPKQPKSKGVGTEKIKEIGLVLNHLHSSATLPETVYQYDIDIDLAEDCKSKKTCKVAKYDTTKLNKMSKGHRRSRSETGSKDPPKPELWKRIVLSVIGTLEHREEKPIKLATDGAKSIYSVRELECDADEKILIRVDLKELTDEYENTDEAYDVTIKLVCRIAVGAMQNFIQDMKEHYTAGNQTPVGFQDLNRILNTVLKTTPLLRFVSIGKGTFFEAPESDGYRLTGGLVNWTGFNLTYTLGWKPFATIDVANAAFLMGRNVIEVLKDLFAQDYHKCDVYDIRTWNESHFQRADDLLRGFKISYPNPMQGTNGRFTRKVTGVSKQTASEHEFKSAGLLTNVRDYFAKDKGMIQQYRYGPCLTSGICVVPAEFCVVQKGQPYHRKLSDKQTAAMIQDTAKAPQVRLEVISKSIESNKFAEDPVLREFGVRVSNKLLQMDARILGPPTLVYGSSTDTDRQVRLTPGSDGVWNVFDRSLNLHFVQPFGNGQPVQWGILNTGRSCGSCQIDRFVEQFVVKASSVGLNLADKKTVMRSNYTQFESIPRSLSKWLEGYFKQVRKLDFVLVILDSKDTGMYSKVKSTAELVDKNGSGPGVLTQCIQGKNIRDCNATTIGNVILKLNMKLGGINNLVMPPVGSGYDDINILREPVMIMGADVTHPSSDSKMPSMAAVTASIDRTGAAFMIHIQAQKVVSRGAAEVIVGLDVIVMKMIAKFISETGHRPRKIIFYRDGVGESQFDEVLEKEMLKIQDACKAVQKDHSIMAKAIKDIKLGDDLSVPFEPKITFVAVQKRHSTRFFPQNPAADGVGRPRNAPPGTVVDAHIVNPNAIDFFLLSHTGIQGTSRPTRYQVLWDDSDFSVNEIQLLSYYLCYAYGRCTRSVSYPAPTYFAHLGATRAKVFIHSYNDRELENIEEINKRIMRAPRLLSEYPMHFV